VRIESHQNVRFWTFGGFIHNISNYITIYISKELVVGPDSLDQASCSRSHVHSLTVTVDLFPAPPLGPKMGMNLIIMSL